MDIAGKLLGATDGLYFVAGCVWSNCEKSKSRRGVRFDPSKLLGRVFDCCKNIRTTKGEKQKHENDRQR